MPEEIRLVALYAFTAFVMVLLGNRYGTGGGGDDWNV